MRGGGEGCMRVCVCERERGVRGGGRGGGRVKVVCHINK